MLGLLRTLNSQRHTPFARVQVVVFSQWTSMLDLAAWVLEGHGDGRNASVRIPTVRLDGAMTREQREKALKRFREAKPMDSVEPAVLLVSMRACEHFAFFKIVYPVYNYSIQIRAQIIINLKLIFIFSMVVCTVLFRRV